MKLLPVLHDILRGVILVACMVAAGVSLRAATAWRHDGARFRLAMLCAVALLAAAAISGAILAAGRQPMSWTGWLRLLPDAALPALAVSLLFGLRRRGRRAEFRRRNAPFDSATNLPRRPLVLLQMVPALARCRREGAPATILLAALDDLPALRAARGPAAVAEALRDFSAVLRAATRPSDLPGHFDADTLGVLLVATPQGSAPVVAERIRAMARDQLSHPEMDGRRVTASIGIAAVGDGIETAALEEAVSAAAAALAAARAAGGDRAVLADPPPVRSAALAR